MAVTDPIADMLTRIRNAVSARHERVVMPSSLERHVFVVEWRSVVVREFGVVEVERLRRRLVLRAVHLRCV